MAVGGIGAIVAQAPAGYNAAFAFLGALAAAGFVLYLVAMPETAPQERGAPSALRT